MARIFVWLGGALFVSSLAFCAFTYVVSWDSAAGGGADAALFANVALFTVFAGHHSLFAREGVKRVMDRVVPDGLRRSVYVWTASLLLVAVLFLWRPIGGDLYRMGGAARLALTAVQIVGLWFIARAVATIDPLELAGIRPASGPGTLQLRGPYRLVRHPLYLGWMLATGGAAHMTGDRLAFALVSSAYLVVAIPLEERSLRRSFGEAYAEYERLVRWRVVPFIY